MTFMSPPVCRLVGPPGTENVIYQPTARQIAFRALAHVLVDSGAIMMRDWLKVTMDSARWTEPRVMPTEWWQWELQPGFLGWFHDDFIELMPTTEEDRRRLEHLFYVRLIAELESTDRETRTAALQMTMRVLKLGKPGKAGSEDNEELRTAMARADKHKWPPVRTG